MARVSGIVVLGAHKDADKIQIQRAFILRNDGSIDVSGPGPAQDFFAERRLKITGARPDPKSSDNLILIVEGHGPAQEYPEEEGGEEG